MRRPTFIARQSGRPAGFLGRLLLGVMARETTRLNNEVLDALTPADGEHLLEIGYGHGRTLVEAAARAPGARFAGIDVSETAARSARRRCRDLIESGRVDLRIGDAAELPWGPDTFDGAFAVHTLYFWSDPTKQLSELHRVLRPGGRLVLGYRERSAAAVARFPPPTYHFRTSDEVAAVLGSAGFVMRERRDASAEDLRVVVAVRERNC